MLAPNFDPTVASVFAPRTRIEADGTVEGYASLFGEIDQARDRVMRGAFAQTLRQRPVHASSMSAVRRSMAAVSRAPRRSTRRRRSIR